MEDEINTPTSFHGRLSRFAYIPPSSSSSSSSFLSAPRTPDEGVGVRKHNWAKKVSDELDGEEYRSQVGRAANFLSESRKRKSKHLLGCGSNSPKLKRSKAKNTAAAAPKVYAHLEAVLLDNVAHDLDVLFCGINPGKMSAERGHHYANPTNHFWHCLHHSGFTPRLLLPSEDATLPEKYNLGLTNLVQHPSTSAAELSSQQMINAVPTLLAKIAYLRPRIICFVGKVIWLHVERSLRRLGIGENDDDPGTRAVLTAHASETGLMPVLKEELHIESARVAKPESEQVNFGHGVPVAAAKPEAWGGGRPPPKQILTLQKKVIKQEALDTATLSHPSPFATGCRTGSVSSRIVALKKGTVAVPGQTKTTFAYGLQPYKAVHSMESNIRTSADEQKPCVRETLFCVVPSTSGRVVSHQRDDKVLLFKALRDDLERVKAGTLDTSTMQAVRLSINEQ